VSSLKLRLVRLAVLMCCVVACLGVGVASASADSWTIEGGTHYLKGSGGEVLRSWTAKEWRLWGLELQSLGECMGVEAGCAAGEVDAETPVEDVPGVTAEYAQAGTESVRGDRSAITREAQSAVDQAGKDAGTLPSDLGTGAIAHATLGPSTKEIAVELGNGLDQLYEVPEWNPLSTSEKEEVEAHSEHLWWPSPGFSEETEECPHGTASCTKGHVELPLGVYLESWGNAIRHVESGEDDCEVKEGKDYDCTPFFRENPPKSSTYVPPGYTEFEETIEFGRLEELGGKEVKLVEFYAWKPLAECGSAPVGYECKPIGVPAPNLFTAEIEEHDVNSGLPKRPKETSPVTLPTEPPSSLTEADAKLISENTGGRERIEAMFTSKAREEAELEEKEEAVFGGLNEGEFDRLFCDKGKSVNCATGNEFQSQTDLSVGGRGPALELALTYNSQLARRESSPGPFGYGWTGGYSAHVEQTDGGRYAVVHQENGSTVTFTRFGEEWSAPAGVVEASLVNESGGYVYTLPDGLALHFNSSGWLTSEADRNGNTLTMTRNSEGRLESVKDAAGREIKLKYNGEGEVESAADPMGHTVKYTYESGNLATVTLPGESSANWKYKYESHQLTSETDGRGYTTTREYTEGKVTSETEPLSRTRKWAYGSWWGGTETTITEPNGAKTLERFNEMGEPVKLWSGYESGLEPETTDEYNSRHQLIASTNPDGHTTDYAYDSYGDRDWEKNPDGDETKWEYTWPYELVGITSPTGEKTTIERDSHGNVLKVSRPAPGETTQATKYKYASDGDEESMTDALGHEWKYEHDSYGDLTGETDPEGNKRTWGYNEDSQETSTVSPRGHASGAKESSFKTTIERDARGRITKITDPLGHETKIVYDPDSDLTSETDPEGDKTTTTYNEDDEPTKVEAPNKTTTETEYNSMGEVIAETDGNKHSTKYERNILGWVTEEINPLGQKTKKEYDKAGNLLKLTDAEKRTTTNKYDSANRLTEVTYSDGKTPDVKLEYNADGNRTKMTDGTGESITTYDQLQRPTETKDGHGDVIKLEYNLDNSPTKITYPNGKATTRAYDNDDRLKSITDWLEHTTKLAYNPDSEVSTITFPSGTSDEDGYAYEDDDAMSEAIMKKSTETLASLLYTRGKDDEVTKATSKGLPGEEKPAFTYEESQRLTKGAGVSYGYDAANNPTTIGEDTDAYNSADELETSKLKTTTLDTYAYNEVGERTKTTPASGPATTDGYDQAGNLTAVERPKEGSTPEIKDSYAYNGEGLRASETISGTTNYLAWDTAEPELPSILSNGTNSFIYGPGDMPIEQINNSTGTVLYLHHDQQGSTRLLTGSTGKVEGKCSYSPYGTPTCEGTSTTPLGYDAQYTSSDAGLIYMRHRVYDPATAQFLSVDPLEAITGEPYNYASDNPVNEADPTGLGDWLGLGIPSPGEVAEKLNPVKYYEEEVASYENGCGYLASVAHGLEGAVVGVLDASGAGEEEAAGAAAEEGINATAHGADMLAERGFSDADIALTKSGEALTQADGATVYLKEVASARFNVIVEGQRGVITALKNIPQGAVERLASGYGWH
jgi:RHS repeat-associated protein